MPDDQLYQTLGELKGAMTALTEVVKSHMITDSAQHNDFYARFRTIEEDINKAKGAKGAIVVLSGVLGGAVAAVWHQVDKILR